MEEAIIALRELLASADNKLNKLTTEIATQKATMDKMQADKTALKKRRDGLQAAITALGG